jgi:hypothetical protein
MTTDHLNEGIGLEDCSREFKVRFWWKKGLRRVAGLFEDDILPIQVLFWLGWGIVLVSTTLISHFDVWRREAPARYFQPGIQPFGGLNDDGSICGRCA